MIRIAISIGNHFYAEGIKMLLSNTSDFKIFCISSDCTEDVVTECIAVKPDILLMDVQTFPEERTMTRRLKSIEKIREKLPAVKYAIVCDEVAYPEEAEKVVGARKTGLIDVFFYASVTSEYFRATLYSL